MWKAVSNPAKTHWVVIHRDTSETVMFFSSEDNGERLAKEYADWKQKQSMPGTGLEPVASSMSRKRSSQLS